jgi:hypothetical protein
MATQSATISNIDEVTDPEEGTMGVKTSSSTALLRAWQNPQTQLRQAADCGLARDLLLRYSRIQEAVAILPARYLSAYLPPAYLPPAYLPPYLLISRNPIHNALHIFHKKRRSRSIHREIQRSLGC